MDGIGEGTLVELDPIDALGWIEMDDGTRVRVGGTALSRVRPLPDVGARLRVLETTLGLGGVIKAVRVESLAPPPATPAPQPATRARTSWGAFVSAHPRWSDVADLCLTPALEAPPLALAPHALFAPWFHEIRETAPIVRPLGIPRHDDPRPVGAARDQSFALGDVAFLDVAEWPRCGRCAAPLELCVQLAPALVAPFFGGGRGFAALFCFGCGTQHRDDPQVGHVGWVRGEHRVVRPAGAPTRSSRPACGTQAVSAYAPLRELPSVYWHRCRAERRPELASSALFGGDELALDGPFPPELERALAGSPPQLLSEDVEALFEEWTSELPGPVPPGQHSAVLGGVPSWDQADETPSCAHHGEMRALLDYEGGQFLDGALHVFVCGACDRVRFVAEF